MSTSILHSRLIQSMIRHCIDEILNLSTLYQLGVIRTKLEAISHRTEFKLTRRDNLVASSHTIIQLLVAIITGIILINRSCCINRPVQIQSSQKTICHILIRLTIIFTRCFLRELVGYSLKFTLNPSSHICTWLASRNIRTVFL